MKLKRELLIGLFLFICMTLSSETIAQIYSAKDVVALRYYDYLSLVNLETGAEAIVFDDSDVIDFQWDKQGKNLFALTSVNIPGPEYESPSRDEVRLYELALPAGTKTLLKIIKVPEPADYQSYSYPSLHLDKKGNPVITLYYGISQQTYLRYSYDPVAKTLSKPLTTIFNNYLEGYKRKSQVVITTEAGKFFNKQEGRYYNLYTQEGDGSERAIKNVAKLKHGFSAENEPLRYSVAPDSSYLLISFRWDEETSMGSTYAVSIPGYEAILLSDIQYLGESFIPILLDNGKLPFYQPIDNFDQNLMPAINCVDKGGVISVLKSWDRDNSAPLDMQVRAK